MKNKYADQRAEIVKLFNDRSLFLEGGPGSGRHPGTIAKNTRDKIAANLEKKYRVQHANAFLGLRQLKNRRGMRNADANDKIRLIKKATQASVLRDKLDLMHGVVVSLKGGGSKKSIGKKIKKALNREYNNYSTLANNEMDNVLDKIIK